MNLKNRVAIVTGGSRGIGKEVALEFEKNGAQVIICSRTISDDFKLKIKNNNLQIDYVKCDVSNEKDVNQLVKYVIKKYKKIDILANVAGISPKDSEGMKIPFYKLKSKIWKDVMQTNLDGTFYFCKEVTPYMIKNHYGRIINMSSIVGLTSSEHGPACAAYVSSKTGMIGLTKAMAYDLAQFNITVNAIAGGRIETEMSKSNNKYYNTLHKKLIPMHRFGNVKEIANAFLFYASEESSYITGDVMNVTGGWYI